MAFRKIEAGLVHADVDEFIGKTGTIFYDNDLGDFRISDGVTPGGVALSFGGGGGGGNYTLPTATTTVKGGVKIDGTTIAIANQVISVGTVPYSSLSGTPTIPTNTNQLTNGAGYITSGALSGYATESYVTGRGYITSSALTGLATETYVTTRGYITSSALTGYATQNYVTTQGYITSAALSGYALTSAIPTDISQLRDSQGLLGQGGGGGGTVIRNVENPYSFSIAGDDSTLREISNGESIKITGASGITVTTDAEGNVTITGPNLTSYATQSYVTTQGYITSSALTGYALTTAIPTNNNQLTNGSGYITSAALTGLATESYVTSRGYITGLSWNQLTDKPNLAGTYSFNVAADDSTLREISADETVKFIGAGGVTTASDAEGNITITGPSLAGLATESFVTSRGYITGLSWNQLTDKPNLAGTYTFNVAADDSTLRTISSDETVKFVGAGGITTSSDDEGKITITGPDLSSYVTLTGEQTLTNKTLTSPTITDGVFQDTFTIGNQVFYEHGYNGFSVNEDFDIVGENNFTGYHYTSGAGREGVAFTLARTGQFTTGFGIHGTAENNEYVIGSETTNTDFVFKNNIGMPFDVSGGTEIFRISKTGVLTTGSGESLETIATQSYVTTQGYITSTALTGLATESFVTSRGYITGLSWDQLTNKPNLAGTYSWSIAADDSTQLEISAGNLVKFKGAGNITTSSDADGNITITGSALDRLTSNSRSAVLNTNGTFSLPTLTATPSSPQAGQMALANGTSWDPIAQGNGSPYMVIYTGTAWIGMGGVTVDQVYSMILELG